MENTNPKINLLKGSATRLKNGKPVPVTELDDVNCNCRFDACDCGLYMTDLQTGTKYFIAIINGKLTISTDASYTDFKASGDYTDLSATVIGTQS